MFIKYRLKRNSGPVYEPIPAHPDAIYRPQNRPTPPPIDSEVAAPRILANNPIMPAPLAAGGSAFSPWWIIGPLLALLAAMVLAALVYGIKKKQNLKKQGEKEENNPEKRKISNIKTSQNKKENNDDDDDDNQNKLPVETMSLQTIKPETSLEEKQKTTPMSSTAKDYSSSDTDPFRSNDVNKESFAKSPLLAHALPLNNENSTVPSAHLLSSSDSPPINTTQMRKPNSNLENTSNKIFNNPLLQSGPKNARSVSTHRTESNYSQNRQPSSTTSPTSSLASTTPKIGQSNDGPESKVDKPRSATDPNKKEDQSNNLKKTQNDKPVSDRAGPVTTGENNREFPLSSSSRSALNDPNTMKDSDDNRANQLNSPLQHGVGQSPPISSIPTGSKRNTTGKPQSRTKQTEGEDEGKGSSNSLLSNPNSQKQSSSSKENLHSNKDNPSSKSTTNELKQKPSSNSILQNDPTRNRTGQSSNPHSISNRNDPDNLGIRPINNFNPSSDPNQTHIDPSNLQNSLNPNDEKSDESNTSLTQPNLTNRNKTISLMPNVPQCKTNTSSSDEEYDEVYTIPSNDSSNQQISSKSYPSNRNFNKNRKNQSSHMNKQ